MLKRAFLFLLTAASILTPLTVPLKAQAQGLSYSDSWKTIVTWRPIWMRNTSASTVAQNRNWTTGGYSGGSTFAFLDSTVFRKIGTATAYDTSAAFPREAFPFPPLIGPGFATVVRGDTLLPWVIIRVRQDTTSYSWSGAAGLDSIRVGIEYSYDGIDWFSCSGTPTQRFDTVFFTSGADGLQSPSVIGVEGTPGEDSVVIPIKCGFSVSPAGNSYIVNQTSCIAGNYIRFLIGGDAIGQFRAEYASWKEE